MHKKVHLAITMGDPGGVGPELCWRSLRPQHLGKMEITLVGAPSILREARERFAGHLGQNVELVKIEATSDLGFDDLKVGHPSSLSGALALEAIALATDLCLRGDVDAMVTAPVSKEAIEMSGTPFTGHTEWISKRCGEHDEMMMMSRLEPPLHRGYATTHIPLAKVPGVLTQDLVMRRLRQCLNFARQLEDSRPVAICGLNPHAGEAGLLGREEMEVIEPALATLKAEGHCVEGPFPADTLFVERIRQQYSVILALYHDQGGIPFKMLAFDSGVNHTLGLPIVRCSVDHGTAWDLAWKGVASPQSLEMAMEMARIRVLGNWKE